MLPRNDIKTDKRFYYFTFKAVILKFLKKTCFLLHVFCTFAQWILLIWNLLKKLKKRVKNLLKEENNKSINLVCSHPCMHIKLLVNDTKLHRAAKASLVVICWVIYLEIWHFLSISSESCVDNDARPVVPHIAFCNHNASHCNKWRSKNKTYEIMFTI